MPQFKTVAIDEIVIPERLRAVEEEHALAIAQSIVEHGLINPITVRHTPNAKAGSYTLVAGAHRLRAFVLNDDSEIEALVIEADKDEAQLVEITENLFRNDLSVMDRAVFVQSYREAWERKHGQINPKGGRPANSVNLTELLGIEADASVFARHVADRMGVSRSAIERLNRIAKHLRPEVRAAVRGTPIADNQSELLKIAKMEPSRQRQLAVALKQSPDLKRALSEVDAVQPKAELTAEDKRNVAIARLEKAWEDADEEVCLDFLKGLLHAPDGLLAAFVEQNFDVGAML
ncbi:MAG: chromosome partitioning protein ParB [Delftia acidovorans]|nr:MAG: chromosome partitioning protein ParB [Delftia acidovorans]